MNKQIDTFIFIFFLSFIVIKWKEFFKNLIINNCNIKLQMKIFHHSEIIFISEYLMCLSRILLNYFNRSSFFVCLIEIKHTLDSQEKRSI